MQALLASTAPVWGQSVSVSSWNDLKAQWNAGQNNFAFAQNIDVPEVTTNLGSGENSLFAMSGLTVASNQTLTIDGNNRVFGSVDHDHDQHVFAVARPIASRGVLNVSNCVFQNNFASAAIEAHGGAVYVGDGSRSTFTACRFEGNHLYGDGPGVYYASGGAYSNGTSNMSLLRFGATSFFVDCEFVDNFVHPRNLSTGSSVVTNAYGGAITNNADSTLDIQGGRFSGNGAIVYSARSVSHASGGAIMSDGILRVKDTLFENNYARNETSALDEIYRNDTASGGAVQHEGWLSYGNYMSLQNCLFENNRVEGLAVNEGGAMFIGSASGHSTLVDCSFYGNTVAAGLVSRGGALYYGSSYGELRLVAAMHDVVFRGNMVDYHAGTGTGRANAITFEGGGTAFLSNYDFRATLAGDGSAVADASVLFYDPVEFFQKAPTNFNINRPDGATEYRGRVIFTGEDFALEADPVNRVSAANANTRFIQHDGVLEIRDGAIVGAAAASTPGAIGAGSYELKKGVLQMTDGGGLLASVFSFNTNNSWKDAVLRADSASRVTADTADFSRGFTFDFNPFVHASPGANNPHASGLQVYAGSSLLGGVLGVLDNLTLDYYMNPMWREARKFLALDFVNPDGTTTGDFDSVRSHKYESSTVDDVHGYQGTWSEEWVTNADGTKELYVVWTPEGSPDNPDGPNDPDDGDDDPSQPDQPEHPDVPGHGSNPGTPEQPSNPGIREILPELAGEMTMNSMWSTRSNMQAMSSAALGQVGINRHRIGHAWNYWAQGLGDFDMHRSSGNRDGFDYHGYGYAVGADRRFNDDNCVLGVAFGSLYGTSKSRSYVANIDQTSSVGMVYGSWLKEFDKKNVLDVTGSAAYGVTSNRLHTYYSDGQLSGGKWHNNAVRLTMNAEWMHDLGNNWTYSAFLGAEYDDVTQKSFSETGDRPRHFGEGKLRNLALPVGMGISKQYGFSDGKVWMHSLRAAYLPDVYRKNPSATATRLTADGYSWTAHGLNVARNAARLEYDTRLIINPEWSVYAGYAIELRKDAVYHNVNLGVSASF